MTELPERSQSMAAYAGSHAEPDPETTARLRERLQLSMSLREARRGRVRAWIQGAALAVIVLGVALGVGWQQGWIGAAGSPAARGVISTAATGQDLALDGGRVALAPHTLVRVVESPTGTEIELVDGELEVRADTPAAITVRVGAYEVSPTSPRFSVRRTPGVPLVTVYEGEIRLRGPDLPAAGVVMTAAGG